MFVFFKTISDPTPDFSFKNNHKNYLDSKKQVKALSNIITYAIDLFPADKTCFQISNLIRILTKIETLVFSSILV